MFNSPIVSKTSANSNAAFASSSNITRAVSNIFHANSISDSSSSSSPSSSSSAASLPFFSPSVAPAPSSSSSSPTSSSSGASSSLVPLASAFARTCSPNTVFCACAPRNSASPYTKCARAVSRRTLASSASASFAISINFSSASPASSIARSPSSGPLAPRSAVFAVSSFAIAASIARDSRARRRDAPTRRAAVAFEFARVVRINTQTLS